MTTTTKTMTADELLHMPSDDRRHELVHGELRTMPPSGNEHTAIIADVLTPLNLYVKAHKLGRAYACEGGYVLARNPDTVRAPDVAFVSQDRLPGGKPTKGFFPGAPDFAVEVMSPGDSAEELDEKVQQWLEAGTKLVWVVNPKRKTVTVYDSPAGSRIFRVGDSLDGGNVVPGFSLTVGEIFE